MELEFNSHTLLTALRDRLVLEGDRPTAVLLLNPKRFIFVNQQHGFATADALLAGIVERIVAAAPDAPAALVGPARYAVLLNDDHALRREGISQRLHSEVAELLRPHESTAMRLLCSVAMRRSQPYDDRRPVLGVSVVTMLCQPELKMPAKEVLGTVQRRADTVDHEVVLF